MFHCHIIIESYNITILFIKIVTLLNSTIIYYKNILLFIKIYMIRNYCNAFSNRFANDKYIKYRF